MNNINNLLINYQIDAADIHHIKELSQVIEKKKDDLVSYVYEKLSENEELASHFKKEKTLQKSKEAFTAWLNDFISGDYGEIYYARLSHLGHTFARVGLPECSANITIYNVRSYLADLVLTVYKNDPEKASRLIKSINKILDLTLDLMTRSCHEEELKTHFLTQKIDSVIIRVAKWFVTGFNIVLVIGLLGVGVLALGLSASDFGHFMSGTAGGLERGVLGMLGSLLILWVIIELLDTQIGHIKGRAFAIKVFVTVALVAELRKILISSLEDTTWEQQAILSMSVLILGFIYWLISRVETR